MAKNKKQSKQKKKQIILVKKPKQNFLSNIKEFYFTNYKKLLFIPISLLLISILLIGLKIAQTGEFVNKGVSLSGGISITINSEEVILETLEKDLQDQYGQTEVSLRKITSQGQQKAIIIESADIGADDLSNFLKQKYSLSQDDMAIEQTGSALGERFFQQTITAIIVALIFMGIIVFLYFRSIIPSFAIILAAVSDLIMTLAVFNLFEMKLTTAGIAAFLMLIGYSVDTDILLSTRVLKRKEGTVNERIMSALSTGTMMNITTLSAISIALIFSQSPVLTQIMTILFIGLLFDMINTWIQNVGILKWYLEKGHRK